MNAVILTEEQYEKINQKLDYILKKIDEEKAKPSEQIIDNEDFLKKMKVSRRTAQKWRDEGIISFSQIGGKIYYKQIDINKMLERNHKKAFKFR